MTAKKIGKQYPKVKLLICKIKIQEEKKLTITGMRFVQNALMQRT